MTARRQRALSLARAIADGTGPVVVMAPTEAAAAALLAEVRRALEDLGAMPEPTPTP